MQSTLTGRQVGVHVSTFALPTWLLALLIADLPLCTLVTEHLDLAVGTVNWLVAAVVVAVCVNLQVQWKTFHTLLRGKVCAQAVDWDEDLKKVERERAMKKTSLADDIQYIRTVVIGKSFGHLGYIVYSGLFIAHFYIPKCIIFYFKCYIQDAIRTYY